MQTVSRFNRVLYVSAPFRSAGRSSELSLPNLEPFQQAQLAARSSAPLTSTNSFSTSRITYSSKRQLIWLPLDASPYS